MTEVVEEVAPGVVRIALPVPGLADGVNVHLVRGDGPTTLVDTGMPLPGALETLRSGLAAAGSGLEDVELVVLTHHHLDHVGQAAAVVAASGAAVAALAPVADVVGAPYEHVVGERRWAAEHVARHGAPDALLDGARLVEPLVRGLASVAVDHVLVEGDVVRAGSLDLTVRHRPGHSPTDTLLEDPAAGAAFVGDHVFRAAPLTPVLGSMLGTDDRPAARYLAALRETAARTGITAFPGHGPALPDVAALVADRGGALERRTGRVRQALTDEPQVTWELGLVVWRGVPSPAHGLTRLAALLASLELLEDAGEVVRVTDLGAPGRVGWRRARGAH